MAARAVSALRERSFISSQRRVSLLQGQRGSLVGLRALPLMPSHSRLCFVSKPLPFRC